MAQVAGHRPLDGHRSRRLSSSQRTLRRHDLGRRSERTPEGALKGAQRWRKARSTPTHRRSSTRPSCTSPTQAFELVKSLANRNFDETVEVAFKLGVDPRKADQMLRSTVSLPAGTGKDVRVAVFATGDAAEEARGRRRRRRRRRRPRRPGPEGLPRLRHRDRDPRPDGSGRQARPGARPAWPHAEPEDRAPSPPTSARRSASSRAARSSTAPTASATCTCRSARSASRSRASCGTTAPCSTRSRRAKPASAKGRYLKGITTSSTMGPGVKINPEVKAAV